MNKIEMNIPLSIKDLNSSEDRFKIEFDLKEGSQTIISSKIEIGKHFHYKVFAYLKLHYNYNKKENIVTIAGVKDLGEKQISVRVILEDNQNHALDITLNPLKKINQSSNLCADFIDNNKEIKIMFKKIIEHTIEKITKEFHGIGVMGVVHTGMPPRITPHNYNVYKAMFSPYEKDRERPTLEDISRVQDKINSIYGGITVIGYGAIFSNVIGSTEDPKPLGYESWIQLWKDTCNDGYDWYDCTSRDLSNGDYKSKYCTRIEGSEDFIDPFGGHVIFGKQARKVDEGQTVFILPICHKHNNNDDNYMTNRCDPGHAVVLNNYFQYINNQ